MYFRQKNMKHHTDVDSQIAELENQVRQCESEEAENDNELLNQCIINAKLLIYDLLREDLNILDEINVEITAISLDSIRLRVAIDLTKELPERPAELLQILKDQFKILLLNYQRQALIDNSTELGRAYLVKFKLIEELNRFSIASYSEYLLQGYQKDGFKDGLLCGNYIENQIEEGLNTFKLIVSKSANIELLKKAVNEVVEPWYTEWLALL